MASSVASGLRGEGEDDIDRRGGDDLGREGQPPDAVCGMDLLEFPEERRGTDDVADGAELDDQDVAGLRDVARCRGCRRLSWQWQPVCLCGLQGTSPRNHRQSRCKCVDGRPRLCHWRVPPLLEELADRILFRRGPGLADHFAEQAERNELHPDHDKDRRREEHRTVAEG